MFSVKLFVILAMFWHSIDWRLPLPLPCSWSLLSTASLAVRARPGGCDSYSSPVEEDIISLCQTQVRSWWCQVKLRCRFWHMLSDNVFYLPEQEQFCGCEDGKPCPIQLQARGWHWQEPVTSAGVWVEHSPGHDQHLPRLRLLREADKLSGNLLPFLRG